MLARPSCGARGRCQAIRLLAICDVIYCPQADDLRPALQTMVHIYHVVEAVQNTKFPGFGKDMDEEGRSAEQKAKEGERSKNASGHQIDQIDCALLPS